MPTPARRQYLEIKAQHQDALLAYHIGDFFEFFDEDAHVAARELQIVLTARTYGPDETVPLAGVPAHALETYLARLLARGYKVAVCEQVSPPGKGLVQRRVTRILTPGTVVEPNMLSPTRDNYLVAIAFDRRDAAATAAGLAAIDASSGSFTCTEWDGPHLPGALLAELERLAPAEVLLASDAVPHLTAIVGEDAAAQLNRYTVTPWPAQHFDTASAPLRLTRHFRTPSLTPFGCDRRTHAAAAAAAILAFLERMNPALLPLVRDLSTYDTGTFVEIDGRTWRALEVVDQRRGGRDTSRSATLLSTLDATRTPMGARHLRRTLLQPLRDRLALERRLDAVGELRERRPLRQKLAAALDGMGDLERLIGRILHGSAVPRELRGLDDILLRLPLVANTLQSAESEELLDLSQSLRLPASIRELIARALVDPSDAQGRIIRAGYSDELDALVASSASSRAWIATLEGSERERTGIRSLKVGYNKVFGYYLEVSKSWLDKVPPGYQRRQTIAGGERYVTPELKEHEALVLHTQEQIEALEKRLYGELLEQLATHAGPLRQAAAALAQIDTSLALAEVAAARNYVRPRLTDGAELEITGGRHPVLEVALDGQEFIANDTAVYGARSEHVDGFERNPSILLLTGPNMAGKSTYLRQVALMTLMAQVGSFVPASSARIGIVDRIFARVGADDDLAHGLSTFMLEMVETAYILRHATSRSLIILDEIGRGTSTADGLAIARAVVEYLHDTIGARTLFATHYHELTSTAAGFPRVRPLQMAVAQGSAGPVFLHRVEPGASASSYGVQVARMAGLPAPVTARATDLLASAEQSRGIAQRREGYLASPQVETRIQASTTREHELVLALAGTNVAAMTPMDAINVLFSLQQQALSLLRMAPEGA